jgi:diacylglycerol kinase (ATP)
MTQTAPNLLFIINPESGNKKTDWKKLIPGYFDQRHIAYELFDMPDPFDANKLKEKITQANPSRVIAVGGDGTVKLVAESLQNTSVPLGILPAGSANGMAKELGIPDNDPDAAMANILEGEVRPIHCVKINDELCIHLSDIGFNAYVVKKFQDENKRGMWGYVKAAWKVLWSHSSMIVKMKIDGKPIYRKAAMVVIANATQYGNGVVINPEGSLYDELFEIVLVKKISLSEIFKMRFTQGNFNPAKTEIFQVTDVNIKSKHHVHFQVDGEYRGKIKSVNATILSHALAVVAVKET